MFPVQIINSNELSIYSMEIHANELEIYKNRCTSIELEKAGSIHHPTKALEYLASRALKNSIFPEKEFSFDDTGAPYIQGEGFLSISHNQRYVVLIHSKEFKVGIDIECIREKASLVSARFCSDEESAQFDRNSAQEMSLLWSFKETLYKLSDRVGLDLLKDIKVTRSENKILGSVAYVNSIHRFELDYIKQNDNYITFNITKGSVL